MLWLCVNPPLPFVVTVAAAVAVAAGISGIGLLLAKHLLQLLNLL